MEHCCWTALPPGFGSDWLEINLPEAIVRDIVTTLPLGAGVGPHKNGMRLAASKSGPAAGAGGDATPVWRGQEEW